MHSLVGQQHGAASSRIAGSEQRQQRHLPLRASRRGVRQPVQAGAGQMSSDAHAVSAEHAVLDRYQALLQEYRLHKSALGSWFGAVQAATQRPPQLLDAQATGDEALVARFQQYLMVRKRLLAEIPLMRQQLDDALVRDDGTHQHHSSGSRARAGAARGSKHGGAVNANHAAPISPSQAVGQFFAAVNYRQQHAETATVAGQEQAAASGAGVPPEQPQAAGGTHGQQSARGEGAASHILTATASSSGGATGGGSRAAAAAMAALAYKRSGGSGGASSSSGGQRQQRPLAMQLAEAPKPPPGYEQQQSDAAAGGAGSTPSAPLVEAGSVAAVYAAAPRRAAALDADVSLEATLQGVPGGLGGGVLFASTRTLGATAADAAPAGSSEADPLQSQQPQAPVGEVVTARFSVVSGRQGRMVEGHLDEFLAGLSEAYSQTPAAAAAGAVAVAVAGAGAGTPPAAASATAAAAPATAAASAAAAAPPKQQSGGNDGGDMPLGGHLPPDILPVPT